MLYSKGSIPKLIFYGIYNGNLCIGHKPGKKLSCLNLKRGGIGIVVTLLQENEGALLIGSQVEKENLQWIWFPFSASNPTRSQTEVLDFFLNIENALKSGHNIYIHCSAGIHRTGMLTYGFLRFIGYSPHESKTILAHLREVTFNQVGADRLTWGDQFFSGRA